MQYVGLPSLLSTTSSNESVLEKSVALFAHAKRLQKQVNERKLADELPKVSAKSLRYSFNDE